MQVYEALGDESGLEVHTQPSNQKFLTGTLTVETFIRIVKAISLSE
jgi:hypothetical protein